MSRRPIAANPVQRAGDVRRRLWSESPIPRPATRRVRMVGATPPPVSYWWKFDDQSGPFTEASGGPALARSDVYGTYRVAGLAPGSAYAFRFSDGGGDYSLAQGSVPWLAGPVTVDVWMSHLIPTSTADSILLQLLGAGELRIEGSGFTGDLLLRARNSGGAMVTLATITSPATPAHLVWAVDPAAGTSRLTLNGSLVSNTDGHDIRWNANPTLAVMVGPPDGQPASVVDELRITGNTP